MKYPIFIIALIFSSLIMQAQKDVIYPEIGKVSIRKCKITDVKDGNVVYYLKDSIPNVIEAVSIRRDGVYTNLYPNVSGNSDPSSKKAGVYNDPTYDQYKRLYESAIKQRNVGIGLTVLGLGAGITAGLILGRNSHHDGAPTIVKAMYIGGGILINAGVIVWVSGGVKASNSKKAMKMVKGNASLSFGLTRNGVGLLLAFN